MRRFVSLLVLLLCAIPFGVSVSGCSKNAAPVFCNGGDSGITTGTPTTITLAPKIYGVSLNYAEIGQVSTPSATDCKGATASVGAYVYSSSDMTIADVQPSTGKLCAGTWNRNTGGGIPDYTVCNPTNKSGTAYVAVSAEGATSNPLPIFVHPVVTSIVIGNPAPGSTATITAWSITNPAGSSNSLVSFTAQNSFSAGQVLSLTNFATGTFFNGLKTAVVQSAGLTPSQFSVVIPGFKQATASQTDTGLALGPGCTTDPTTACSPAATDSAVTATPYSANACVSQGRTAQLVARVYAGTGTNQTNISQLAGHLQFTAQTTGIVTIDQNGVATAAQPGSTLITANISNAASSAGVFSTCPPTSIALSVAGSTANPVPVNLNNNQPLLATVQDQNGVALTGLSLEFVSTQPIIIPVSTAGTVTPSFAGAASIFAICQPATCNPASYSQIGLFGNGKPITSNSVNITTPGTNSTVLYMASTQSQYVVSQDFTVSAIGAAFRLPYVPNSMVLSNDGSTLYFGSSSGLMVVNAVNTLSLTRVDTTVPGYVLSVSPDNSTVVLTDPSRQTVTIETSAGAVTTTYGGVGTHAAWAPDSQSVYITTGTVTGNTTGAPLATIAPSNQVLAYSGFTGWTPFINPAQAADIALTVPSVGAYLAGTTTIGHSYCPVSTPSTSNGTITETNTFYPVSDTASVITDRIAATNSGRHILGATVTPVPTLNDLLVTLPSGACPSTGSPTFSSAPSTTILSGLTANSITGVWPTSDSSIAYITYTGSGGVLPAYRPAASGVGQTTYIKLSGSATAPISGVESSDNATFYVGTSGDNLVHLITRSTLTDTSTLAPKLTDPNNNPVPVNLIAQKPRKTT